MSEVFFHYFKKHRRWHLPALTPLYMLAYHSSEEMPETQSSTEKWCNPDILADPKLSK